MEQIAASGACKPYEKEFICKDGSRVPVLIGSASFEDSPEEGVCFFLDLTERKSSSINFFARNAWKASARWPEASPTI